MIGTPILQVKQPRPGDRITNPHHQAIRQQQPNGLALKGLISEQRRQVEEGHLLLFIPCASVLFKFVINSLLVLLFKSSTHQKELMDKRNGPTSLEKKKVS